MTELFKTIIKDFQNSLPKAGVKKRELKIPLNTNKVISLIGPRRCGKTFYLFQLINDLFEKGAKEGVIYINCLLISSP